MFLQRSVECENFKESILFYYSVRGLFLRRNCHVCMTVLWLGDTKCSPEERSLANRSIREPTGCCMQTPLWMICSEATFGWNTVAWRQSINAILIHLWDLRLMLVKNHRKHLHVNNLQTKHETGYMYRYIPSANKEGHFVGRGRIFRNNSKLYY